MYLKNPQGNVYIPCNDPVIINEAMMSELRNHAMKSELGNSRILLHRDATNKLHEMLIVHKKGPYIRPHINKGSSKSYIIIDGEMVVAWFKEDGDLLKTCFLSSTEGEMNRIIRFENEIFHTLLPLTTSVTFVETILGPHVNTIYAPWAPTIDDPESNRFWIDLSKQILHNLNLPV